MRKTNRIITIVLVACLIFSTTSTAIFASDVNNNYQANQNSKYSFISNDEEYTIEKQDYKTITETKMYDSQGKLVGHMKYNKVTDEMLDLLNNKAITVKITQSMQSKAVQKDSEGYYYQGSYTVNLGYVAGAAALILTLVTRGYTSSWAQSVAGAVTTFGASFIYIKGQLWMKTDGTYDYVKKIEKVYEEISGNNHKIAGPFTMYQKKAV